jgi:biopolymer transport protein ExbB
MNEQVATQAAQEMSLWDFTVAGGIIMIPLAILALLCIYVFIERWLVISRDSRQDSTFMSRIKDYVHEGEIESALNLCNNNHTAYSALIAKGLTRIGRPMQDVLVTIENEGNLQIARLGKGLPWLATTAAGAPMLGFLGTVVGMVEAFHAMAVSGSAVAGLAVGVCAMFAYNCLVARINNVMTLLEGKTMEFMDLLNEPGK